MKYYVAQNEAKIGIQNEIYNEDALTSRTCTLTFDQRESLIVVFFFLFKEFFFNNIYMNFLRMRR